MDFIGLKCPVCDIDFKNGDDIVVCPQCGTPHHRECYEKENKCYYHDKHGKSFNYDDLLKKDANQNTDNVPCPVCNTLNPKDSNACRKCGSLFVDTSNQNSSSDPPNQQSGSYNTNKPPFGFDGMQIAYDPMGGVKPDYEISDGVTAGEMAKYVKSNTPYFLRIFLNIKNFSKSRFNFSAFLFSGGYYLYRKQYKIGTIFTVLFAILLIAPIFIQYLPVYGEITSNLLDLAGLSDISTYSDALEFFNASNKLPAGQMFIYYLPGFLSMIRYAFMLYCGFTANRTYYSHCTKKIKEIKKTSKTQTEFDTELNHRGGVNMPLATSLFICYIIIIYLPDILQTLFR